MAEIKGLSIAEIVIPEGCNVIVGQSHFIKTAEDLYEALITSSPTLEFGIAFCEASGDRLIRVEGNSQELSDLAAENACLISAGHSFVIVMRNGYPINVMDRIKSCQEVCGVFAATANPLQVIVVETDQGRGIVGVVDGFTPKGIETDDDKAKRRGFLRDIVGYKR